MIHKIHKTTNGHVLGREHKQTEIDILLLSFETVDCIICNSSTAMSFTKGMFSNVPKVIDETYADGVFYVNIKN